MTDQYVIEQLGDIREDLGGLKKSVEAISGYIHDWQHRDAQTKQVEFSFQEKMIREIGKIKEELSEQNRAMHEKDAVALAAYRLADREEVKLVAERVRALEDVETGRGGLRGALDWFATRIGFGWIAAAMAILWATFTKDKGL